MVSGHGPFRRILATGGAWDWSTLQAIVRGYVESLARVAR